MSTFRSFLLGSIATMATSSAIAQDDFNLLRTASSQNHTVIGTRGVSCATAPVVIYETTRTATQGAELTAVANGAATCMGDLVVLAAVPARTLCEVEVDVFSLASVDPFDLTLNIYSACSTSGGVNTACGDGAGTLLGSASVTGITPPALGEIFSVLIPIGNLDLSGDADSTLSFSLGASRGDVFWRINETPTVGSLPPGEPATSFVERCGSTAANNGCQRNFGVNNNFAFIARAIETYTVTPSASAGGSIDPATAQTVASGQTTDFTLTPDAGFYLSAVNGTCGGSLVENVFITDPIGADCTVEAQFEPRIATTTAIAASINPVRVDEVVSFEVTVSGSSAPSDGQVDVIADSGESCIDNAPPQVSGNTATFSCDIAFGTLGPRSVTANFSGSSIHDNSSSAALPLGVARIADLSVTIGDGQGTVLPNEALSYLIEVRNAGPDDAPGSLLVLASTPELQDTDWTCSPVGAAACPAPGGAGELGEALDLPAGSGLDFIQNGVAAADLGASLVVEANLTGSETAPNFVIDPDSGNNQAIDVNVVLLVFADGFE